MFSTSFSSNATANTANANPANTRKGIDSIALIHMREIMNWSPKEGDDPIFFLMKRVQQCIWLLVFYGTIVPSNNMLKIFKHIIGDSRAAANKAAAAATNNWCRDDHGIDYPYTGTLEEMDKALEAGLKSMDDEESSRLIVLWETLWEFTNNGNDDYVYDTEIIINNFPEYREWLKRVLVLVEEAFK